MTYQEFNKKVLDYYISRSSSTFFTLSLDSLEFENLITLEEINHFELLKSDWNALLILEDNIPQYFGLIAIQCYAASIMHNDGKNASDNYKVRLRELLKLDDVNALQNLFIGANPTNPVQEEIWQNAKIFLENTLHQKLDIPQKRYYAGRYVQYPKSQALLNTEDLNYFTIFFSEEFQVKENFSFEYFKKRLDARFHFIDKTIRTTRLWDDEEKQINCIKQVYDFYNLWEGQIHLIPKKNKPNPKFQQKLIAQKLILIFQNGVPTFYITGQDIIENNEIAKEDVFKIKNYKYIHEGLLIFNEMEYYPDEYEDSRFLFKGPPCYILIDTKLKTKENIYLKRFHDLRFELSENLLLYKYNFEEAFFDSTFNSLIHNSRPFCLTGGLRISRKRVYLKGYGPSIKCDEKFEVIYENKKLEYDPEQSKAGFYRVRMDNYSDIEFCILEKDECTITVDSKCKGWNFKSYFIADDFLIEGCYLKSELLEFKKPCSREWITANINKDNKLKYKGNNILIKAIYNSQK